MNTERNNKWLATHLTLVWQTYFSDVLPTNEVQIVFGRRSKTRLGSIGMNGWQGRDKKGAYNSRHKQDGVSVITITGYFKDENIPEYVVDATIGHELVHYAHGFHSPYPQLYQYPHQGGIVDKEMRSRGMGEILKKQRQWLKKEWLTITNSGRRTRVRVRILRSHQ